jgi:rare lipoprotein A
MQHLPSSSKKSLFNGRGPHIAVLCLIAVFFLSACGGTKYPPPPRQSYGVQKQPPKGTFRPYCIDGVTYHPLASCVGYQEDGIASWYGKKFHGRKTASGEVYNMYAMTAAHKTLPMFTKVRVLNLENGRSADFIINDRGPFVKKRIIDLSYQGARTLGIVSKGTARVRVTALGGPTRSNKAQKARSNELYYVQVASYRNHTNASRVLGRLQQLGYSGSRMHPVLIGNERWWRVQAGVFSRLENADQARKRLAGEFPASFIIEN